MKVETSRLFVILFQTPMQPSPGKLMPGSRSQSGDLELVMKYRDGKLLCLDFKLQKRSRATLKTE